MTRVNMMVAAVALALAALGETGSAADWSDTSLAYRYGTRFAEPFGRTDITRHVFSLTHASGYKYGGNFFNADLLQSDRRDPAVNGTGEQEVYVVYRHTLDFGKVFSRDLKFGFVRGVGATLGFDWNTKNDAGYSSKKRQLVIGPTLMLNVTGFLNVGLLVLKESNAPTGVPTRYTYDTHPALDVSWGIPIGSHPLSFGGYLLYIGSKGKDEFGHATSDETHLDARLMLDIGTVVGGPKKNFFVGFSYEYWKNKFGNPTTGAAGPGATAKTPTIRLEYHF